MAVTFDVAAFTELGNGFAGELVRPEDAS